MEISVRLSDLVSTKERFHLGASRIQASIQILESINQQFQIESAISPLMLSTFNGQSWDLQIEKFAILLDQAHQDFSSAMTENARTIRLKDASVKDLAALPQQKAGAPLENLEAKIFNPTFDLPYVSPNNQLLWDKYSGIQEEIKLHQTQIDELLLSKSRLIEDHQFIQIRLKSYGNEAQVNLSHQESSFTQSVSEIDAKIEVIQAKITDLNQNGDVLFHRLQRVGIGEEANIDLIKKLEHGKLFSWDVPQEYGCVRHIAQRMPVPAKILQDARLWDNFAMDHPEYGIGIGSEPLQGSVIVMEPEHTFANDTYGHLMYVEKVENGEVWITDNFHPSESVRLSDLTKELSGANIHYLYFPWHTSA